MTANSQIPRDIDRYRPLGLVANPFAAVRDDDQEIGVGLEIYAAANRLLSVLSASTGPEATRPVLVSKTTEVPSFYHLRAISMAEAALINDDGLSLLHGYVQLYMMRRGRVRSTLGAFGERLVFRGFDQTMALYFETVLDEPDTELASYQLLGPEALDAFKTKFAENPVAVFAEYFGDEEMERRPELAQVADLRLANLDVDAEELDSSPELDGSVADAPGTGIALPEDRDEDADRQPVIDYLVEYTSTHLSPVVARGLRVYRERGLAAVATELRVTKAPRKTLSALIRLARLRFAKTALIYDGFEGWGAVPPETRQSIVGTMTELRWMLDGEAVIVFLLEEGLVPELEEAFSGGSRVSWEFLNLVPLQSEPDTLDIGMVEEWLASAALPGSTAITMQDPVLSSLAEHAAGSLSVFAGMALSAFESAADRGVSVLDGEALAVAKAATASVEGD